MRLVELLRELKAARDLTVVMVSNDLAVVAALCDEIAVLDRGQIVERGESADVLGSPRHPHTRRLVASMPRLRRSADPPR
ncbi:hypothetical protein [Nonomuraea sp. NPDC005650]|uniref:hypothetical protein n=1 Tax=Nonomuraea sp. NPDC005650 TaxID=3157045 RepID=UPI0033B010EF